MNPHVWLPIDTAPTDGRQMFVVRTIAITPFPNSRSLYTSDPWCVWRGSDGSFVRWPHDFQPTHWVPLPEHVFSDQQESTK
jgi:hypothetical protein